MVGSVYVMEQRDYDNWLAGNLTDQTPAEIGQDLVQNKLGCASCHQDNSQGRGPSFKGIFGKEQKLTNGQTITVDENYIRNSIVNPQGEIVEGYQPIMPTFKGQVSEEQINAIVEYIKSLGDTAAPAATAPKAEAKPSAAPTAKQQDTTTTSNGKGGAN